MKVVIGIGDPHRRDEGVGPALVERLTRLGMSDVDIRVSDGEPAKLLEAWTGARLAIVVSSVLSRPARPGQIHRKKLSGSDTHGLGVSEAVEIGRAQGRLPDHLIVYAVEAADVGDGTELSPAVAAAIPELLDAVITDLERAGR